MSPMCQLMQHMSFVVRKPAFCICKNKDADQLHSNCAADQRLCFCYTDSTILLLPKSEISSFKPSSVAVQPGLCLKPRRLIFSQRSSYDLCHMQSIKRQISLHILSNTFLAVIYIYYILAEHMKTIRLPLFSYILGQIGPV